MKLERKRLFINNLPENATQEDVQAVFAAFGEVLDVEIKLRKNIGPNQASKFAYIQLHVDKHNLQSCLQHFTNEKWMNQWVPVQEAKESFMERLKREREEQQHQKPNGITPSSSQFVPEVKTNSKLNVKKQFKFDSESSSDEGTGQPPTNHENNVLHPNDGDIDGFVIKRSEQTSFKDGLKIKSAGKEPIIVINNKSAPKRVTKADEKRIQSMMQMRKEYQQQRNLIKNALSSVDCKPKNKIIFDEDGGFVNSEPVSRKKRKYSEDNIPVSKKSNQNLQLFEDDEDEDETNYNFNVQEHLEGKKGRKLMELQSRFKNDKRFAMDSRFLDDESDEDKPENEHKKDDEDDQEITLEEEKRKQFEILDEVLGNSVPHRPKEKENDKKSKFKAMVRFDPSQPDHSRYEVEKQLPRKKDKHKQKSIRQELANERRAVEVPKPEVSKDTFFKVTLDLKDSLQEKEGFSLANMFSSRLENEVEEAEEEEMVAPKSIKKTSRKSFIEEPNPFKYDSSSDEEEEEGDKAGDQVPGTTSQGRTDFFKDLGTSTKLWTESFFFKDDDYRLQEGLDFIKRLQVDDQENFSKLRRNLHEIAKAKVRNTQRKNRPFRKKLGGKKRIRVKRAMKR